MSSNIISDSSGCSRFDDYSSTELKGSRSLGVAASLACVLLPALLMELYYNKAGRADSVHTNDNNNTQYQSNSDSSNRQQSSSSGAAPTIRAKHEKLISEVLIQLQTILLCPALVPVLHHTEPT